MIQPRTEKSSGWAYFPVGCNHEWTPRQKTLWAAMTGHGWTADDGQIYSTCGPFYLQNFLEWSLKTVTATRQSLGLPKSRSGNQSVYCLGPRPSRFVKIPIHSDIWVLGPESITVYAAVRSFMRADGPCVARNATIGQRAGMTERQVKKWMAVLERHGFIFRRESNFDPRAKYQSPARVTRGQSGSRNLDRVTIATLDQLGQSSETRRAARCSKSVPSTTGNGVVNPCPRQHNTNHYHEGYYMDDDWGDFYGMDTPTRATADGGGEISPTAENGVVNPGERCSKSETVV